MNEPQSAHEAPEIAGEERTTLTDEEIDTRPLVTAPRASVDDEADPGDPGDSGDDTGDDSGDVADTSDTGDDSGDDSGDSDA